MPEVRDIVRSSFGLPISVKIPRQKVKSQRGSETQSKGRGVRFDSFVWAASQPTSEFDARLRSHGSVATE